MENLHGNVIDELNPKAMSKKLLLKNGQGFLSKCPYEEKRTIGLLSCTHLCEYSKGVEYIWSTKEGRNSITALIIKCSHELCSEKTLPKQISIIK